MITLCNEGLRWEKKNLKQLGKSEQDTFSVASPSASLTTIQFHHLKTPYHHVRWLDSVPGANHQNLILGAEARKTELFFSFSLIEPHSSVCEGGGSLYTLRALTLPFTNKLRLLSSRKLYESARICAVICKGWFKITYALYKTLEAQRPVWLTMQQWRAVEHTRMLPEMKSITILIS